MKEMPVSDVLTREQRHLSMSHIHGKDTKPEEIVWNTKAAFLHLWLFKADLQRTDQLVCGGEHRTQHWLAPVGWDLLDQVPPMRSASLGVVPESIPTSCRALISPWQYSRLTWLMKARPLKKSLLLACEASGVTSFLSLQRGRGDNSARDGLLRLGHDEQPVPDARRGAGLKGLRRKDSIKDDKTARRGRPPGKEGGRTGRSDGCTGLNYLRQGLEGAGRPASLDKRQRGSRQVINLR